MTRSEIARLAKYGEECLKDSYSNPEIRDKLLALAEEQFNLLINQYTTEKADPMLGYLYTRLGEVKYNQKKYLKAEKAFLESLNHLVIRGEYCEDRAQTHFGLTKTYMKLANEESAREHFIRAVHIYDSLSMQNKIDEMVRDCEKLTIKLEDILPAKQINSKGEPTVCRECGGSEFKKIRIENEKLAVYDCINCGCRSVIILDMLELISSPTL